MGQNDCVGHLVTIDHALELAAFKPMIALPRMWRPTRQPRTEACDPQTTNDLHITVDGLQQVHR